MSGRSMDALAIRSTKRAERIRPSPDRLQQMCPVAKTRTGVFVNRSCTGVGARILSFGQQISMNEALSA
jgi:hypothetical protein